MKSVTNSAEHTATANEAADAAPLPLLYKHREFLDAMPAGGTTTSCQTTQNPDDYGPDD